MLHKLLHAPLKEYGLEHRGVVIRREHAVCVLANQLEERKRTAVLNPDFKHTAFISSTVDPAPNAELMEETAIACTILLEETCWDVRILSKSTRLPDLVMLIPEEYHHRLILGVSTGTLNDKTAKAIEQGTPLVSKRIQSLHWLQDRGFRTFGMICPSLPQVDYEAFSEEICDAIRVDRCEHVWAEPINVRGASFARTFSVLEDAGLEKEAGLLSGVFGTGRKGAWEEYAQATFLAHTKNIPAEKLRFLHYPSKAAASWWATQVGKGAVLL